MRKEMRKTGKSFWEYLQAAGLNPYYWELVSERSQALVIRNRSTGVIKTILK